MQSEQQQRIMGYFIEEAKDHLNTIEQGLLSLQSTIADTEMVSEVFRAAHSVKGGAAMLGLGSIQKTAHRLEDYFKVLKECPIKVDQKLESLFLRVFDTLQELIEQLQGPFGLTDDKAQEVMADVEPVFNSLNEHLGVLVSQAGGIPPEDVELSLPTTATPKPVATPAAAGYREESALQLVFQSDVPARLRDMLQLFKQADTPSCRQQLQDICRSLAQAGEQFDLTQWVHLSMCAEQAIANSDNTYRTLAPILIRDIKQAQELVLANQAHEIFVSEGLQALIPLAIDDQPMDDFANLLAEINFEDDSTQEFIEFDLESDDPFSSISSESTSISEIPDLETPDLENTDWLTNGTFIQDDTVTDLDFDLELEAIHADATPSTADDLGFGNELDETKTTPPITERNGPEVGLAELNSLADLFEGEVPDLGMTWQEEEVIEDSATGFFDESTSNNDFSDLLEDPDDLEDLELETDPDEDDLSALLTSSERMSNTSDASFRESAPAFSATELPDPFGELSADSTPTNPTLDNFEPTATTLPDRGISAEVDGLENLGELFLNLEEDGVTDAAFSLEEDALTPDVSTPAISNVTRPFDILADPFDDPFQPTESSGFSDPFAADDLSLSVTHSESQGQKGSEDDFFGNDPFSFDNTELNLTDDNSFEVLEDLSTDDALIEALIQDDLAASDDLASNSSMTDSEEQPTVTQSFDAWAALDAEEELELPPVLEPVSAPDLDVTSDLWDDGSAEVSSNIPTTPPAINVLNADSDPFGFDEIDIQPEVEVLDLTLGNESDLSNALWADETGFNDTLAENAESEDVSLDTLLVNDLDDEVESLNLTAGGVDVDNFESLNFADAELSAIQLETNDTFASPNQDLIETEAELAQLLSNEITDEADLSGLFDNSSEDTQTSFLEEMIADPFAIATSFDTMESSNADLSNLFEEDEVSTFDPSLLDNIPDESIVTNQAIVDLAELNLSDLDALDSTEESSPTFDLATSSDNLQTDIDTDTDASFSETILSDDIFGETLPDEPTSSFSSLDLDLDAGEETSQPVESMDFDGLDFDLSELNVSSEEMSDTSDLTFNFDSDLEEDTSLEANPLPNLEIADTATAELGISTDADASMFDFNSEASTDADAPMFDFDLEPSADTEVPTSSLDAEPSTDADAPMFDFSSEASTDADAPMFDFDLEPSADTEVPTFSLDAEPSTDADAPMFDFDLEPSADTDSFIFSFDEHLDPSTAEAASPDNTGLETDLGELTLDIDEALGGATPNDEFASLLDGVTDDESASMGAASELDDLDTLLNSELTSTTFETSGSASLSIEPTQDSLDFSELDSLLGESFNSPNEPDPGFDLVVNPSLSLTDSDDFADLDALLAGDLSLEPTTEIPDDDDDEFANLDLLLNEPPTSPPQVSSTPTRTSAKATSGIGEFDDLEKLLEDADQTLGGSPTTRGARGPSLAPNRNKVRPTRGVLSDQTMRVSVKNLDNLNNLVGELVVNRNSLEQAEERLRQFLDNLLYQVQQLGDVGQRMRDLYERSLLESSLLSSRKSYQLSSPGNGGASQSSSHVTGASFDALEMDRFTGFHTLSQEMIELIVRVRESASDIDFVVDETDQVTRNFRQITTQLQEGLTRSRMVPFAQTADRLPRAVRDISLKCGKQAELIVEGRETLIDKMILEQLYDPMTHLVNNAITHGIEMPEERASSSKPPMGRITVRTFHQGNQTVISVSDDGAGINPETVKRKAVEKGLIGSAEAREMSRLDVYDLLFHHGFSTKDKADDFAGRGVGMDVVRTSLNEIRGVINIDSTVGRGTTFTIRLPLTLSISKALCCISNRARIAFPMDGVEDMLDVPKERIQRDSQDRPCIQWRDQLLPFQPLSELLRYNRNLGRGSVYGGNQEEDIVSVVVLRSNAGNFLALQVDQVLGEQEIVIKQLEGPVPKPIGVAGATVLGDGRIMPIADVLELIDLSLGRIRREAGSSLWEKDDDQLPPEIMETKTEPTVLIVDDSITVRELLSMTFNKIGYRVEQARDGQEAWEKLRSGLPCDLVFCDIEMPRMDGLELLSRIQKDPALTHLPIAMLTSRGADRHRQMAIQLGAKGYFTKPYLEEALLDAAQRMLKGEVLVNSGT